MADEGISDRVSKAVDARPIQRAVDTCLVSSEEGSVTQLESQVEEGDSKRYCWVCFAAEEDDSTALWVQPCRCRGTTKWVHQSCIQRWVDEKQKGNTATTVTCPQCNTEYIIVFPQMGLVMKFLDSSDQLIYRICPFVAAGIVAGSVYWTAVTYGAVTFMQVFGQKEGMLVMEQSDPLVLLVGLPTIPILLILGRMVRWEDSLLQFLRQQSARYSLLTYVFPSFSGSITAAQGSDDLPPLSDPISATRVLCGALLLPSIATAVGKVFFESVESSFHRALLGGIAFITVKGIIKIYHKQQQYVRQRQRKILDFVPDPNTSKDSSERES